jgi:hypothetical protein
MAMRSASRSTQGSELSTEAGSCIGPTAITAISYFSLKMYATTRRSPSMASLVGGPLSVDSEPVGSKTVPSAAGDASSKTRFRLYEPKRAEGFEPSLRAWKALVQPLHHTREN